MTKHTAINTRRLRLSSKERLGLFSDLGTMLKAGISILEAIESLENDSRGNVRRTLQIIHRSLANGESLADAMDRLPAAFDPITINLVRAAEAGGTLEETLHSIVRSTKKELAFSDQMRTTMIYPAFVMVVFLGILLLMLTFVIPRVAKVFSTLPVHLSPLTRAVFATSSFFLHHWLLITGGMVALLLLVSYLVSIHRRAIAGFILSLPLLNTLGKNLDLARFTRSFGLLMHVGIPVDEALALSKRVIQKKRIAAVVQMMQVNIESGAPLSRGLRHTDGVVPPIMSRSIETAEKSGTLDETLQNLTEYFDEQVTQSLKVIGSLVEPVLLVVVGVLVGTLMITVIGPIYGLISQISLKG